MRHIKAFCRKTPLAECYFQIKTACQKPTPGLQETTPGGTAFQRVIRTDTGRTGRVLLYFHGGAYRDGLVPSYRNFSTGFFQAANGCETIYLFLVRSGLPIPHTIK